MPRASSMAYWRRKASSAAYSVWLVTTRPTSRASVTVQIMSVPALERNNQYVRTRVAKPAAVWTPISG
jgi:hypothetical protein